MVNPRVRPLGSAIGSLVLVTGIGLLPAGTASAAPMPQANPATMQATTMSMMPIDEILVPVGHAGPALTAAAGPQNYHVDVVAQPPPGDQDRRLTNGQFVRAGSRTGRGEMTVDNGGGDDAVVSLTMNKRSVYSVYVRKGSKYTVTGIRDGTYEIFFTTGADWDSQNQNFTRDRTFQRFDQTMTFTTTTTATERRWSTWNITLYPVVGGNANTSTVNPNDYPGV